MATQFQSPKGVAEYVPPESSGFLAVRDALAGPATRAGYGYLELPVFEDTALYVRGVGESTDVVSKEMYTFDDRGGRSISLRPEGTAGVVRAVIEHGLDRVGLPVKVWYAGPFFRAERPQQGRYRQFHQVGLEALGTEDPALDAEVIALADEGFRSLALSGFRLLLNSLGDAETRLRYRETLTEYLATLDLDEATRKRAEINPMRVLDDKRPALQAAIAAAPQLADVMSIDAADYHEQVQTYLRALGIEWVDSPRLVRGLDYYSRTTFEFVHDGLGAQSAIGGGGRYDGLMAALGGQELSGIGYGIGVDRTLLACRAEGLQIADERRCEVFLIPMGVAAKVPLVQLAARLRADGVSVDLAYGDRSVKAAMRAADRAKARLAVVLGDRELEAGTAEVKDLTDGQQQTIAWQDVATTVQEMLSR
ncbi:MAG: histidine--tRNA ligase [Candidatus Nanopelagicales bacterium]